LHTTDPPVPIGKGTPKVIHRLLTGYPQEFHRVIHRVLVSYPQVILELSTGYPQDTQGLLKGDVSRGTLEGDVRVA